MTVLGEAVRKCGYVDVKVLDNYVVVTFSKIYYEDVDYWAANIASNPRQFVTLIKRRIEAARFRVRHPGVTISTPWGPIIGRWKTKVVKDRLCPGITRRYLYVGLHVAIPRKLAEAYTDAFYASINPEDRTAFMSTAEWRILRAYVKGILEAANYTCN
ncbi:hypothetical protein TTSV1_gp38 [Thermoproteus tenax spherical virus 1]|uniref:Uncharacterized protein n=1 Tax=Thermoproteus tenax spherical virus 1 TaxID=292639 RepID=Q647C4_9VIRU|nr:hypothetical protein TTSV1_gp38 [Thermoproteus tenax spherical virus 1]AAU25988.1 hypothetical protein [Thermoproteus tenax spherical virus 1]